MRTGESYSLFFWYPLVFFHHRDDESIINVIKHGCDYFSTIPNRPLLGLLVYTIFIQQKPTVTLDNFKPVSTTIGLESFFKQEEKSSEWKQRRNYSSTRLLNISHCTHNTQSIISSLGWRMENHVLYIYIQSICRTCSVNPCIYSPIQTT